MVQIGCNGYGLLVNCSMVLSRGSTSDAQLGGNSMFLVVLVGTRP